jgi:hypothetical protein
MLKYRGRKKKREENTMIDVLRSHFEVFSVLKPTAACQPVDLPGGDTKFCTDKCFLEYRLPRRAMIWLTGLIKEPRRHRHLTHHQISRLRI